jgi:hypothetical protein
MNDCPPSSTNQLRRIFGKSVTTARKNDPSGEAWRNTTQ